ncbi:MAG: hypothetical protein WCD70_03125 [Alphaproteobacteria bacterium]|jgi:hypothetical protein
MILVDRVIKIKNISKRTDSKKPEFLDSSFAMKREAALNKNGKTIKSASASETTEVDEKGIVVGDVEQAEENK